MQQPTPQGTAPAERRSVPEYLSILQGGNCRETRASCKRGGSQVETITIRLPDVEAAMLISLRREIKALEVWMNSCEFNFVTNTATLLRKIGLT
jgi:hypothetical protein